MSQEQDQPQTDFTPVGEPDFSLTVIAEQTVCRALRDGTENMSDDGLRFIRYVLSMSRSARFGFLPNFASEKAIRDTARQFIRQCGSAAMAIYTMQQVLAEKA